MKALDILRDVIKSKPILFLVVFSVIGCLFGWWVMGYVIWPVQYTGESHSYELSVAEKEQYLSMLADSYRLTGNSLEAKDRLRGWNEGELALLIANLSTKLRNQGQTEQAQRIEDLANALSMAPPVSGPTAALPAEVPPSAPTVALPAEVPPSAPEKPPVAAPRLGGFSIMSIVQICIGLIIILIVIAAILFVIDLRRRKAKPAVPKSVTGGKLAPEVKRDETALGHFVTRYTFGDDHYDESFSIETVAGDFLGECGVGISESLQEGAAPGKVTALEVWLFDKSDIRTITKVLASEFAFNDAELRDKLAAKGELLLAATGQSFDLKTDKLAMQARVIDCQYGEEDERPNSYFKSLTMELIVRPLEAGPAEPELSA